MSSSSFDLMWDWWLFVGRFLIFCKFNSSDSSSKPCSNSYHLIIQCLCINMVDEIEKSPQLNRCIPDTLTSPTKWTNITAKLQAERFGLGVTRHVRSEEKNRGNKIKPQSFMIFLRKIKRRQCLQLYLVLSIKFQHWQLRIWAYSFHGAGIVRTKVNKSNEDF